MLHPGQRRLEDYAQVHWHWNYTLAGMVQDRDRVHPTSIHTSPPPGMLVSGVRGFQYCLHCQVICEDGDTAAIQITMEIHNYPYHSQYLQLSDAVVGLRLQQRVAGIHHWVQ